MSGALDPSSPPDPGEFGKWDLDQIQTGMRLVAREMRTIRDVVLDQVTIGEAEAHKALDVGRAKARITAKANHDPDLPRLTVQDLDDLATAATEQEAWDYDLAVGARRAAFARLRSLEAELSCLQSVHRFFDSMERGR